MADNNESIIWHTLPTSWTEDSSDIRNDTRLNNTNVDENIDFMTDEYTEDSDDESDYYDEINNNTL